MQSESVETGASTRGEVVRRLFVAFGRADQGRIDSYAERLALFDLADIEAAVERSIAESRSFPSFMVLRAACEKARTDRLAKGALFPGQPKQGPRAWHDLPYREGEAAREIVKRRLAAMNYPPGFRRYDPENEGHIRAHWEQFAETLNLGPYVPPGGGKAEVPTECRIHDWIDTFLRAANAIAPGRAEYGEAARGLFEKAHREGRVRTEKLAESWGRDYARGLALLQRRPVQPAKVLPFQGAVRDAMGDLF